MEHPFYRNLYLSALPRLRLKFYFQLKRLKPRLEVIFSFIASVYFLSKQHLALI